MLDSEEREVKVVFVVLGSCAGTSALPGTPGAPACSFPYGSPGHVVEEDRIALPFGEATFVSQVLRFGNAENLDGDETLLQLAQALFGILDVQALHEALRKVLFRLHSAALPPERIKSDYEDSGGSFDAVSGHLCLSRKNFLERNSASRELYPWIRTYLYLNMGRGIEIK